MSNSPGIRDWRGRPTGLETVEVETDVLRETDAAWLLDDGDDGTWVPKSQVERHGHHFIMPLWIAKKGGWA